MLLLSWEGSRDRRVDEEVEGWVGWVALLTGGGWGSGGFLAAPSGSPLLSLLGVLEVPALGLPVGGVPRWSPPSGSDCCRLNRLLSSSRALAPSSALVEEGVRNLISLRTLPSPPITVRVMCTVPPSPDW